jgi:hypothetical protein
MSDDDEWDAYITRVPDPLADDIEWFREQTGLNKSEAIRTLVRDALKQQSTSIDRLEAAVKKAFKRSTITLTLMVIVWMQMKSLEAAGREWAFDEAAILALVGTSLVLYGIAPTLGMFKVIWDEYGPDIAIGGETA